MAEPNILYWKHILQVKSINIVMSSIEICIEYYESGQLVKKFVCWCRWR